MPATACISISENVGEPRVKSSDSSYESVKSFRSIIWKRKNFVNSEDRVFFCGSDELTSEIKILEIPCKFFMYFFTDDLLSLITNETSLFSTQKDPNKPLVIESDDIKKFVGICIIMSFVHLPSAKGYWNHVNGNKLVQQTMSENRFEKIKQFIHFGNNENVLPFSYPQHDRLFKLSPVIEKLKERFQLISFKECLSIDEQICATKARSYLKQYLPSKPNKWGYKLFVLCGVSGFSYDFEVYTGQENNTMHRLLYEPDLGA